MKDRSRRSSAYRPAVSVRTGQFSASGHRRSSPKGHGGEAVSMLSTGAGDAGTWPLASLAAVQQGAGISRSAHPIYQRPSAPVIFNGHGGQPMRAVLRRRSRWLCGLSSPMRPVPRLACSPAVWRRRVPLAYAPRPGNLNTPDIEENISTARQFQHPPATWPHRGEAVGGASSEYRRRGWPVLVTGAVDPGSWSATSATNVTRARWVMLTVLPGTGASNSALSSTVAQRASSAPSPGATRSGPYPQAACGSGAARSQSYCWVVDATWFRGLPREPPSSVSPGRSTGRVPCGDSGPAPHLCLVSTLVDDGHRRGWRSVSAWPVRKSSRALPRHRRA